MTTDKVDAASLLINAQTFIEFEDRYKGLLTVAHTLGVELGRLFDDDEGMESFTSNIGGEQRSDLGADICDQLVLGILGEDGFLGEGKEMALSMLVSRIAYALINHDGAPEELFEEAIQAAVIARAVDKDDGCVTLPTFQALRKAHLQANLMSDGFDINSIPRDVQELSTLVKITLYQVATFLHNSLVGPFFDGDADEAEYLKSSQRPACLRRLSNALVAYDAASSSSKRG